MEVRMHDYQSILPFIENVVSLENEPLPIVNVESRFNPDKVKEDSDC